MGVWRFTQGGKCPVTPFPLLLIVHMLPTVYAQFFSLIFLS